ncbi:MAG: Acyl dehydratase-like protein [Solirubrobacterales bacterium]|nr:Acyl dehydratase-like protein [Solirubrobacterales bacterium]
MTVLEREQPVAGPWYEDLEVGHRFDVAPGLTLTDGHAALHQAILGDRLRLPLDAHLCARVTGERALAHPGLVCDVAIGQSTVATQRVIANLFYRGLVLRRAPRIGDTLRTVTEVVALRDTSPKPGRAPTGLAVLRIRTVDQEDRPVLDFHRCAMLPLREEANRPGHADDLDAIPAELPAGALGDLVASWDLDAFRELVPGLHADGVSVGGRYVVEGGDTVTAAPELARLTLNVAAAHTDPGARGQRLVYGGHTIGVALAHATRALPNLVTVAGWRSCDHLAPVAEGDVLRSVVTVEAVTSSGPGALVQLRVETRAAEPVLDWRLVAVMA